MRAGTRASEPIEWKRETEVAPWVVCVLAAPARKQEAEER